MKIKNLKLKKRFMSLLLAGTMFIMSGCVSQSDNDLMNEISSLKGTITELKNDNKNLAEQVSSLQTENADMETEIEDLELQLKELLEQNSNFEIQVEETKPAEEEQSTVSDENSQEVLDNIEGLVSIDTDKALKLFYSCGTLTVESISDPYYLPYYNSISGGADTGAGKGYVCEIKKDGIKYLVDANDFTKLLASNYEEIYCDGTNQFPKIVIKYPTGETHVYQPSEFVPTESKILQKTK